MNGDIDFPQEIFGMISDCCWDDKPTVQYVNELIKSLSDNPSLFIKELSECVTTFANENGVCNTCGNELRVIHSKEESEYEGFPVYEDINEKYCNYCKEYM